MTTFKPVDLSPWFNSSRANASDPSLWSGEVAERAATMPGAAQTAWGIPFELGPTAEGENCWLVFGRDAQPLTLPLEGTATHVIVAHFCNGIQAPAEPVSTPPGEHLADYVLVYADGGEHRAPGLEGNLPFGGDPSVQNPDPALLRDFNLFSRPFHLHFVPLEPPSPSSGRRSFTFSASR